MAISSTASARMACRRGYLTSPAMWYGFRPAISTTMPSPCSSGLRDLLPGSCSAWEASDDDLADSFRRYVPPGGRRAAGLYQPRRRRSREAQCALDRAVDHADHLRGVADPGLALRSGTAGLSVRRKGLMARQRHH